jgi:hypothetical protein
METTKAESGKLKIIGGGLIFSAFGAGGLALPWAIPLIILGMVGLGLIVAV